MIIDKKSNLFFKSTMSFGHSPVRRNGRYEASIAIDTKNVYTTTILFSAISAAKGSIIKKYHG